MSSAIADTNLQPVDQVSAGGVVFRTSDGVAEIAIVQIVPEMRWQLPKGLIDPGETNEQAALREVREESGIEAELGPLIDTIDYWFFANRDGRRTKYHKFVHFYLMHYRSGDTSDHDHEVAESRWATIDDALRLLEFKTERDVVRKAAELVQGSTPVAE